ncbi:hypothetical protein ACTJKC_15010 [Pedobacter sp. 22226]|uniref:hypothetical protein n=1 Tax=Pedobacter sp. 22226 TaxID=3453894 RepID=UPI003F85A17C
MYIVQSGEISPDRLYEVIGTKSVIYNGETFDTGDSFRGVYGITDFSYTGSGSEQLTELSEIRGSSILFEVSDGERNFEIEQTSVQGMSMIFELNNEEKIVQETTEIKGMSITLADFPYYAFQWTETRYL